jgi:hypothetical protein
MSITEAFILLGILSVVTPAIVFLICPILIIILTKIIKGICVLTSMLLVAWIYIVTLGRGKNFRVTKSLKKFIEEYEPNEL